LLCKTERHVAKPKEDAQYKVKRALRFWIQRGYCLLVYEFIISKEKVLKI
jgi:hypothetical protein